MTFEARVIKIGEPASIAGLMMSERVVANPGFGEVTVAIKASSVNFHDYAVVTGRLGPRCGIIPMSDGAGTVVAVGDGVDGFAVGDHVVSLFFPDWRDGEIDRRKRTTVPGDSTDGYATTHVVRPASWFMAMPKTLSFKEAATLPCAALTAWRALMVDARIKPGDWVLTQGTGGVSLFAVQFAKLAGARVIATSSSDKKLDLLANLGVDHLINYRSVPEWGRAAAKLTGGGVDAVVEVGGAGTLDQSINAVRMGGHISLIGVLAGLTGEVGTARLMAANATVKGVTVGSRRHQSDMFRAIEAAQLKPILDRDFPLDAIGEAFRYQESGNHFGKITIATTTDRSSSG